MRDQRIAVKGWLLVNATGRGKPIPVPGSFRYTKRGVKEYQDSQGYTIRFIIVRGTVTFTVPRSPR